jgi:S-adenosylmethionine:tRNA ribosyltransferase-isomerase
MPQFQPEDHDIQTYDFHLPENLIAQEPVTPRDSSKLLVIHRKTQKWEHRTFRDLPEYLNSDDLVIANNTRVLKARLLGHRIRQERGEWVAGGKVEFVLLEQLSPLCWEGLFHASARYVAGLCFEIPTPQGKPLRGTIVRGSAESPSGTIVVEFDRDPIGSGAGELPLPHYIERSPESQDEANYQTVYAKHLGSAAAPTAGLHFTEKTMQDLASRGVQWDEVTLHVGLGTFRPVKSSDIREHVMHEERYEITDATAKHISDWKKSGKRVLAVGTTSVRTLESAWKNKSDGEHRKSDVDGTNDAFLAGLQRTSIFIRPGIGFQFQVVDRLLTNFHLPKSTLLMLVCTFAGRDLTMAAYEEAVKMNYRFFSYGDAMLILE